MGHERLSRRPDTCTKFDALRNMEIPERYSLWAVKQTALIHQRKSIRGVEKLRERCQKDAERLEDEFPTRACVCPSCLPLPDIAALQRYTRHIEPKKSYKCAFLDDQLFLHTGGCQPQPE